ncbi:NTF2-like domain-containing protein [Synechococcus sp. BIOS-U3-1]|nr:NTF2-like domain-containing protein [Synechococcus sp. BIOS-U3-1]
MTAEQLMRSRYSAYALAQVEYLIVTHPNAAGTSAERRRELRVSCRQTRWHGLKVLATHAGGSDDLEGTVCFEALFSAGGARQVLRENSLFRRRDGQATGEWLYICPLD